MLSYRKFQKIAKLKIPGMDKNNLQNALTKLSFILGLIIIIFWLRLTPNGLLGKADAIGYAVCHRIGSHSFYIGERQLPLCARCTGEFLSVLITILYLASSRRRYKTVGKRVIGVLSIGIVLFLIDGINSVLHLFPEWQSLWLYPPANWIRLLSGSFFGVGLGTVIVVLFNRMVWVVQFSKQTLLFDRNLLKLFLLVVLADVTVLTNNPILLFLMALLSVLGVWAALAMIYSLFWLIISKKENSFRNYSELSGVLFLGAVTGLFQIAIIDLVRYISTGTWSGFTFG